MKKRRYSVIIALVLIFSLCLSACGGGGSATEKADSNTPSTASSTTTVSDKPKSEGSGIQVDEKLLTVDVTLPASFFEGKTEDDIREAAENAGYKSYKLNDDGSVTYTMTKAKRDEMLNDYKESIDSTIEGMISGENQVESFTKIEYNNEVSEFDIYVDAQKHSMWDNFYVIIFYTMGSFYQNFAGANPDDVDVIVNFVDKDTLEVLETSSYRSYLENNSGPGEDTRTEPVVPSTATPLDQKETVVIDDICEFYVDYTNITNDVRPPSPGSWYSHYEADTGKKYVDICISYKNLATSNVSADDVWTATLSFADKYQYSGFSMLEEENRGDFTYSNITSISPLATEYLHYLFEITDEMADSTGKLSATITINSRSYTILVRDGETGDVISPNPSSIARTSGEVKKGDMVAIPNVCEFFVDYSNITGDVLPPSPASFYSHYQADSGKVYVDICFGYKNWKTAKAQADKVISAQLKYADKYEYSGFSMIEEDSRGDFTYSNITSISPLCTEYVHYLFEVPDEVGNSDEPIVITFTVDKYTYTYSVR